MRWWTPVVCLVLLLTAAGSTARGSGASGEQEQTPADTSIGSRGKDQSRSGPVPEFYQAPDIKEVWRQARAQVQRMDPAAINRQYVLALIDSLAETIQYDFDSLASRARAVESSERGYTHKYYRSSFTRGELLEKEISRRQAVKIPHFHAAYDPQGYLVRVRYQEPRRWRATQLAMGQGTQQPEAAPPPFVRYFRDWNLDRLQGREYLKKRKMTEGAPYYRFIYDQSDQVQRIEHFDAEDIKRYHLDFLEKAGYGKLEFIGVEGFSLLEVDPYLFHSDRSLVKPRWMVAVTRDSAGMLASVQVFNQLQQLIYYYTYQQLPIEQGKSAVRVTLLSGEAVIESAFTVTYDQYNRISERAFFNAEGNLLSTINYTYRSRSGEVLVTTRNAAGIILSQRNYLALSDAD